MADDSHDLGFKMSKKIAQLTKVIYQLNCRNEDNDASIRTVTDRYEVEIAGIMSDARQKISSLRDQLASKNDESKIDAIVKQLTAQHQKEKADAVRQFEEFKSVVSRNELAAKKAFEERLQTAAREVSDAKDRFNEALEAMRAKQKANMDTNQADAERVRKLKDSEMEELVKEYNERYKSMMAEQLDLQDRQEKELNREWQSRVDAEIARSAQEKRDMMAEKQQLADTLSALESAFAAGQMEISRLKNLVENMEKEIATLRQRELSLNAGSSDLAEELCRSKEMVESIKSKHAHLLEQFTEAAQNAKRLESELEGEKKISGRQLSQITTLENSISALTATVASLKDESANYASQLAGLKESGGTELIKMSEMLDRTRNELATANEKLASSNAVIAEQLARIESLKSEMTLMSEKNKSDVESMLLSHRNELASVQLSSKSSATSLLESHSKELASLRKSLEDVTLQKENEMKQLKASHANEVTGMKEAERALRDELAKLTAQNAALRSELESATKRLENDSVSKEKELSSQSDRLRTLQLQLDSDAAAHTKAMNALLAKAEMDRAAMMDEHATALAKMQSANNELTERLREITSESEKMKRDFELQLANTSSTYENRIKSLEDKHANEMASATTSLAAGASEKLSAEITRIRKENADFVASLKQQHEMEMLKKESMHSKLMEESTAKYSKRIEMLESELISLKVQQSDSKESSANAIEELQKKLLAEAQAHRKQLSEELEAQKRASDLELSNALSSHSTAQASLSRALEEAKEAHRAEVVSLSEHAKSVQQEMEERFKSQMCDLDKRHEDTKNASLNELRAHFEKELADLKLKSGADQKTLSDANSRLATEISALSSSLEGMNKLLDKNGRELMEAHQRISSLEDEKALLARQHVQQMSETKRAMEAERNQMVASIYAQHQTETERMTTLFTAERDDLNLKIKQLRKRIADLEYKYANRESRAEDVEKINSLLKDLREKDDALLKAYSDMKFYKLELVNREESYNKVFGRQPTVAPLDAAKPNAPSSAPPAKTFGADMPRGRMKSLK